MRKVLLLSILAASLSFALPVPAQAGCCMSKINDECFTDVDLIAPDTAPPPGGWTKANICLARAGTYLDSCSCATPADTTTKCCVLTDGTCQQPDAQGQCTAASMPSMRACDELFCNRPAVQAEAESTGISFKPQIPLPGSELFNGQEITITGSTLGEYIAALYVFVVTAISILAVVMVFYGGLKWLTAGGDRGRVQDAKDQISSAIIGILLAFGAYLLLLAISPKLVRFNSLVLKTVPQREGAFQSELAYDARGATLGTVSLDDPGAWLNDPTNGIRVKYGSIIDPLATSQVPLDFIYAIIFVESGGRPSVTSSAGACGIMQVLPTTAGKSCQELLNPAIGIPAGVAYLRQLASNTCPQTATRKNGTVAQCRPPNVLQTHCSNGDLRYVAAGYNGGQGANCGSIDCPGSTWWECSANTGYQETRNYVAKVEAVRAKLDPFLP